MVNLKTLSEYLGLSQATVSRGLNGFPEVREETRRRIFEAADELGYRPNPNAQKLATGRANSIGFIFPGAENLFLDPHFGEFLAGISSRLARSDVDLTFAAAEPEDEIATYERFVRTRRADVLILTGPKVHDPRLPVLEKLKMPFVLHGRTEGWFANEAPAFDCFDIDNAGGFARATEHLLQLGHRRIACVNGDVRLNYARDRQIGYGDAIKAAGLTVDPLLCAGGPMTEEEGFATARRMLALDDPPTAYLCGSILLASGVARALRGTSQTVGKNVALVAHDDVLPFLLSENFEVPLTVLRSPIREGGTAVADLALERLAKGSQMPHRAMVMDVEFVVRESSCAGPFAP
ncbi:MAG: substrate-binding domain-containing protein [Pseudomonadota bacterium]